MHARVLAQIDALHRHRDPAQRAFATASGGPGERDHGTVVIGIHFRAQHQHAGGTTRLHLQSRAPRRVTPFGKIRDAFDQRAGHFTSDLSTSTVPRIITRFTRFTPK